MYIYYSSRIFQKVFLVLKIAGVTSMRLNQKTSIVRRPTARLMTDRLVASGPNHSSAHFHT
jgi:hypothetical protein